MNQLEVDATFGEEYWKQLWNNISTEGIGGGIDEKLVR